jgi:hypothetical protein
MKLNDAKIDAVKFEQGAWVGEKYDTPIPEMGDLCLKVRGINNADWRRLQQKLYEAVPRSKRIGGRIDPDEMDRITTSCLLSACLIAWENVEGDDGQPLEYSKPAATKILNDPEMRRFREAVVWAANVVGEQSAEDNKEIVGN